LITDGWLTEPREEYLELVVVLKGALFLLVVAKGSPQLEVTRWFVGAEGEDQLLPCDTPLREGRAFRLEARGG
jgi:hypothetical protein